MLASCLISIYLKTQQIVSAQSSDICVYPEQPASGQEGTRVTIFGTNLLGVSGGVEITGIVLI